MSQSNQNINENESKDRSLTEWNFSNPRKYLIESNLDSVIDVNDVELELFRSEKLPYKYGGNYGGISGYQNKFSLKGEFLTDSENVLLTSQCDQNTNTFVTCISNIKLKENVPLSNSNKSYIAKTNDLKAMNKPVSNSNSSPTFNYESIEKSKAAATKTYQSKNVHKTSTFDNNKDFCSLTNDENTESSHGIKYNFLNEVPQIKISEKDLFQKSGTDNMKVKGIRKYHSTLNLEDSNTIPKLTVSQPSSQPSMSKSLSLNNLSSFKALNYDHIQSKVKRYIQERKKQERRNSRSNESKSLPVTPVKGHNNNFDNQGLLVVDEEYLENLCISNKKQKEDLPDDLKQLKQKLLGGNTDPNLVEMLFNHLKRERECRINQNITLNALQVHYDSLLTKYAQAENIIDNLRFSKDKICEKKEDTNTYPNFKKAYSTSNIFVECSSFYDGTLRPSNLVRYSSSPLVDPDLSQREIRDIDVEEKPSSSVISLNKRSHSMCTLDTSFDDNVNDWLAKCEYVNQKVKEFIILESKAAFDKNEREMVWNFILNMFSQLQNDYHSLETCSAAENCKSRLDEISKVIEDIDNKCSSKFPTIKYHHIEDENCFPPKTTDQTNLPSNSSYSNIAFRGLVESRFDSSSTRILPTNSASYAEKPKPNSYLKYSSQRDGDSGCPPSDRSTRNSQCPSFEQPDSLMTCVTGAESVSNPGLAFRRTIYGKSCEDLSRRKSMGSLLNLSSINLGIEENPKRRLYNQKEYRYRSLQTFDEDYDASASSDLEDSFEDERSKKYVRKRVSKSYRTSIEGFNKYEDKFICNHRSRTTDSHSSKYESNINKPLLGMSQMEKNSKFFEGQVKDLKLKGLLRKRVDKKRYPLPYRPNTPLKALTKENLSLVNMSDISISSSPKMVSSLEHSHIDRTKGSGIFTDLNPRDHHHRQVKESNSSLHCSFPEYVPSYKNRKYSTSTPKSQDSENTMCDSGLYKEPISASSSYVSKERKKFAKRSVSVPSLYKANKAETPNLVETRFYPVQHCCQVGSQSICCCHHLCSVKENLYSNQRSKKNVMQNEIIPNDYPRLMAFLNEATELAEAARTETRSRLRLFKTADTAPSAHR